MNFANHKRSAWIAVGCVGVGVVWLVNYYVSINLYLHLERDDPEIIPHVNATSGRKCKKVHMHVIITPHITMPMMMTIHITKNITNKREQEQERQDILIIPC